MFFVSMYLFIRTKICRDASKLKRRRKLKAEERKKKSEDEERHSALLCFRSRSHADHMVSPTRFGVRQRRFVGAAVRPHGGAHAFWRPSGAAVRWPGGDGQAQGFGEGGAPGGRSGRKRGELGRASETAIVDTIIEENAAYETKATPAPSPPRR